MEPDVDPDSHREEEERWRESEATPGSDRPAAYDGPVATSTCGPSRTEHKLRARDEFESESDDVHGAGDGPVPSVSLLAASCTASAAAAGQPLKPAGKAAQTPNNPRTTTPDAQVQLSIGPIDRSTAKRRASEHEDDAGHHQHEAAKSDGVIPPDGSVIAGAAAVGKPAAGPSARSRRHGLQSSVLLRASKGKDEAREEEEEEEREHGKLSVDGIHATPVRHVREGFDQASWFWIGVGSLTVTI